jgi:hypothetical protein
MKGIDISIPPVLAEAFWEQIEDQKEFEGEEYGEAVARYEALKNFWYWLALNPNPESRRDAFNFIEHNNVKLTPKGNLVLYRRIVSRYADKFMEIAAISQTFYQLKSQGKDPNQFLLYKDPEMLIPEKHIL